LLKIFKNFDSHGKEKEEEEKVEGNSLRPHITLNNLKKI